MDIQYANNKRTRTKASFHNFLLFVCRLVYEVALVERAKGGGKTRSIEGMGCEDESSSIGLLERSFFSHKKDTCKNIDSYVQCKIQDLFSERTPDRHFLPTYRPSTSHHASIESSSAQEHTQHNLSSLAS